MESSDDDLLMELAIAQAETGSAADARQMLKQQFARYADQLVEQQLGPCIADLEEAEHWAAPELLLSELLDLPTLAGFTLRNADFGFDRTNALFHRGVMRQRLGRFDDAIVDFTAILAEHPKAVPVIRARAECYANLQRWRDAGDDFQAAIDASGDKLEINDFYHRALTALGAGECDVYRRTRDAMIERWAKAKGTNDAALVAWTCVLGPEGSSAEPLAERAATNAPDDKFAALVFAATRFRTAGADEAKLAHAQRQLESALKSDEDLAVFEQLFLALICQRQGDSKQAKAFLE